MDFMNNLSFGEKLASLRKEKGWSQEELANKLNVSRQAVSKWESNNAYPETDKIATICKLFNSSMDELIGLKSEKSNKNNFSSKINYYIDLFIKGIRMFYSMTFKQKIKCLIEFCFYSLILILIFICVGNVIRIVLNYFFDILPFTLFNYFSKITFGIFILAYLILSLY